ncbi:MAG TPA: FtsX-like permease family protein [Anaerolineae bacterium]
MLTSAYLVLFTSLRHIGRHKLRTLLTLLGIVAGVATFIFAPSLAASIAQSLKDAIDDMAGRAELEVRGPVEGFGERALRIARGTEGVSIAAPLAQAVGVLAGRAEPLAILGVDPAVDRDVRTYHLAEGRFLGGSSEVLLAEAYAHEQNIRVGQRVTLIAPGGSRRFIVVGLLAAGGVAQINSGDMAVTRLREARALRGDDRIDSIALTLKPGAGRDAVASRLRRALPGDLDVDIPQARSGPLDEIQAIVNFIMAFASFMVLGLGSTLVYNTMAVAVAQRRTEIGVLRALGLSRAGVRRMFLIESGAMGLIGSAAGIGLGYALVQASSRLLDLGSLFSGALSSTITPDVPGWLPFIALAAGVGIPVLAGVLPARAAARVDPVEALAGARPETGFMRINRLRVAVAISILTISVTGLPIYAAIRNRIPPLVALPPVIAVELMMVGGVILLLPSLLVALGRVLPGLMHRLIGVTGLLAAENLTKRPKRMTSTAIVLLVSAWAAVVTSSTNLGYRDFVDEWNASENTWDLTVSGAGATPFKPILGLPDSLPARIARRPGVAAVVAERITSIDTEAGTVDIRALDVAGFRAQGARFLWNTGDEATAYLRLQDQKHPAAILSSFAAFARNVNVGDLMTLDTPSGPARFEIVGTVLGAIEPAKPGEVSLILDRAVYQRLWHDERIDRLLVKLKPGSDAGAERRALQDEYAESGIIVLTPADLSAAFGNTIQNIVRVSQIMSLLLWATLMLGVGNTLVINVLDRRREMGMLRALGLHRRQIVAGILLETIILVIMTSVLAVPMGMYNNTANALTMQHLFAVRFTLAPGEVILTLVLLLLSASLATYAPARQAGQMDVLEALRYE